MRLRGLVFERFVTFNRAEVDLCDESGAPLEVVLFIGESGAGKTALLRGVSGLLSAAAGGADDVGDEDIGRGAENARCRVVFDDVVDGGRIVVTLEKELPAPTRSSGLRGLPPEAFEQWRTEMASDAAPRAAFSFATSDDADDDGDAETATARDPLVDWLLTLRGSSSWDVAIGALDLILWPCRFDQVNREGELVFVTPSGLASSNELGDAFGSVFVMALELLRLSMGRPTDELVYVIDDIDAHLHPRAQSRIIGDLHRAFPRVQLVATTHSPFVVASVEPSQVFRLERGAAGTSVVRVSDRIQRGDAVSQVMDLAFGAPDLPGPRWPHAPSLAIRRELLQFVDDGLTRGAVVYTLPEPIHVKDVRDAFGEAVLPFTDSGFGHLFFVDLEPGAAWGHACEYIFRTGEGKLSRQRAIWPPTGLDRFVPIGRG